MRYRATAQGNIPFTAEENAARDAEEAQAAIEKAARDAAEAREMEKLTGIEILGVMCSATKDDQAGLNAVAAGTMLARSAGQTLPPTRFEFSNGNSLVITDANFNAIYATWTPFRQSFFGVE
jgi:hypothetical protein